MKMLPNVPCGGCGREIHICRERNLRKRLFTLGLVVVLALGSGALTLGVASSYSSVTISIRGKEQSLAVYDPAARAPGRPFQIILTSGDLGWVGLPVDIAEYARNLGFRTIGFNARAYLSSFTGNGEYLDTRNIPGDYQAIIDWSRSDPAYPKDVVMIGVSEGAGLNVVGLGQPTAINGCRGLIALGLPARISLGWHWTDFPMWITKKDPNEPQAYTRDFLPDLRVPLVMIHSSRDEYDPIDRARNLFTLYRGPKRFIAVDAANHRFSNKVSEVMDQVKQSLQWLQNPDPQS